MELKCKYDMTKEEYITEINKILEKIDFIWLLDQIYRFCVNLTKDRYNIQYEEHQEKISPDCEQERNHQM